MMDMGREFDKLATIFDPNFCLTDALCKASVRQFLGDGHGKGLWQNCKIIHGPTFLPYSKNTDILETLYFLGRTKFRLRQSSTTFFAWLVCKLCVK